MITHRVDSLVFTGILAMSLTQIVQAQTADCYRDKIEEIRARRETPGGYAASVNDLPRAHVVLGSEVQELEKVMGGKPNIPAESSFDLQRLCSKKLAKLLAWKYSVTDGASLIENRQGWQVLSTDSRPQGIILVVGMTDGGNVAAMAQVWAAGPSPTQPLPLVPHLRSAVSDGMTYAFGAFLKTAGSSKDKPVKATPISNVRWAMGDRSPALTLESPADRRSSAGIWFARQRTASGVSLYLGHGWMVSARPAGRPAPPMLAIESSGGGQTWLMTAKLSVAIAPELAQNDSKLLEGAINLASQPRR